MDLKAAEQGKLLVLLLVSHSKTHILCEPKGHDLYNSRVRGPLCPHTCPNTKWQQLSPYRDFVNALCSTTLTNVNCFQAQLTQQEHAHAQRLLEVTARHHQELDLETDRLRDSQLQAEQALESREKAHRQRVRCLEEQVFEFGV